MVTQFHTLLHFVTQNHTIFILSACAAASTRNPGVSKSHLLGIISDYAEHLCLCYRPLQRGLHALFSTRLILHGHASSVKIQFHTVYVIFFYAPCCQY